MIEILPFTPPDAEYIVKWNEGRGEDFLVQWSGRGFTYPLTAGQVTAQTDLIRFKIVLDGQIIGTIAIIRIDTDENGDKSAYIGHFLLSPDFIGKGYGTEALKLFASKIFTEYGLKTIFLVVFSFNKPAMRCYEKVGFKKLFEEERQSGWVAVKMSLSADV